MLIDLLPIWVLFLISMGLVLLSAEIGFRLGRTARARADGERESPASSISGTILGLQAFMLAFTFGIVSDRYDTKKELIRAEADAIRAAYHRADFLPEPDSTRSKALMEEYVDRRIEAGEKREAQLAHNLLGQSLRTQQQLWDIAVANTRNNMDSEVGALYVESINDIANLHARRVSTALQARIPTGIWLVHLSLLTLGMIGLGYHTAIANSRRPRVTPLLAVAFSLVIALIAALDHPGDKLIPVSQQDLVNLQSEIRGRADTGTD
jgi:hypothetical protein